MRLARWRCREWWRGRARPKLHRGNRAFDYVVPLQFDAATDVSAGISNQGCPAEPRAVTFLRQLKFLENFEIVQIDWSELVWVAHNALRCRLKSILCRHTK